MISSNYIPEKISEYNAYLDGSKMIGVAASVTLPEINMKTSTVSGVGVNGELDSPTIGQFESAVAVSGSGHGKTPQSLAAPAFTGTFPGC